MKAFKFLADESLEFRLVNFLKKEGHDVLSIQELTPSISDKQVLDIAYREKRIILTNDKDFGNLVFLKREKHHGIILFRLHNELVANKISIFEQLLADYPEKIEGNFIVVESTKIRIRI